jgi:integrase
MDDADAELCPTRALDRMFALRTDATQEEPLFADASAKPITKADFEKNFKKLLIEAGFKTDRLSPHSLRRGGATFLLECGVPPVCIKLQGDWASDAWMIYAVITQTLKDRTIATVESALNRSNQPRTRKRMHESAYGSTWALRGSDQRWRGADSKVSHT